MHAGGPAPLACRVTSKPGGTQMLISWSTHGIYIINACTADAKGQRPSMGKARRMMVPGFQLTQILVGSRHSCCNL